MPNRFASVLTASCVLGSASVATLAQPAPAAQDALAPPQPADATALSGVTVVARKPEPTEVSGVTVAAKRKGTPLSGLTVVAGKCPQARRPADPDIPPPKLVSSFPAKGAVVRPGILILRLTFDRPMTCDGLLDIHAPLPNPCPAPLRDPLFSRDRRTFLTVCSIGKGGHYGLRLNHFTSLAGRSSEPYELVFDTSASSEVASIDEAVAQDEWLRQAAHPRP